MRPINSEDQAAETPKGGAYGSHAAPIRTYKPNIWSGQ